MVYNRDGTTQPKKPRIGFSGKLVSIATDNAGTLQEHDGKKADNAYLYLDLSVVDETQTDADGKHMWHNIRVSGSKDNPIVLAEQPVLAQCDALLRDKKKPLVRGQCYISTKIPTDENGDPVMKDGKPVVYKNKRMSLADLETLEIVEEDAAAQAA